MVLPIHAKSLIAFFRSLWKVPYFLDVSHVESPPRQAENMYHLGVVGHRKITLRLSGVFLKGMPTPCPEAVPKCALMANDPATSSCKHASCCCLHCCPSTLGFALSSSLAPFLWESPSWAAIQKSRGAWAGDGDVLKRGNSWHCPSGCLDAAQASFPIPQVEAPLQVGMRTGKSRMLKCMKFIFYALHPLQN